ncbi:putative hydrolase YxeP [bacterium BMS3Abin09]|nr:putative hydrolase YxeP [bacterium BMS3Abin09]GBE40735.1 putative hydrolase YxeP [bacterium BMS3Bbin09]HDO66995.1 amidohydrolase [Nitrospirota bacterium]HEW81169.1 amidohydrolase [Nitrospirota bacterium]
MNKVNKIVNDELFEWIRDIRREIHQWPELAFKEEKTAELIAKKLKKLGIKYQTGIAGTGVVGKLIVDESAPTVAIRADMDALPVTENTGLPYSSQNPGIMHACGHDGHIAIVLGTAAVLKHNPPEGNVVFIFQPAEEEQGGAKPMIEQGVLDGVDAIFGGHIERHYQVGQIGIKTGIHTSHTDTFVIKIIGKGGHAARPHLAIDAVLIASQLVVNIQSIISRQIDPIHPSVITIGYLKSGTVDNVIAEKATLKGTIRTTNELIREEIIEKIRKLASSMTIFYGAEITIEMKPGYPPIVNEERASKFAVQVAEKLLGKDNTIAIPYPSLGGEDFSYYLQQIPGCFVRFGAAKEGHETASSHSPDFDFDEEALRVGAAYMSELVRFTIKKLRKG